jgi:hypothetical protein
LVCRQVWEGKNIVLTGRKMIGATNPQASEPGTIRGDYAIEVRVQCSTAVYEDQRYIDCLVHVFVVAWFVKVLVAPPGSGMVSWCCVPCSYCHVHGEARVLHRVEQL